MRMKLELSQKQLLSQKMIQSIEILQMNAQELKEYLNEIALENPVIDIDEGLRREELSSLPLSKAERKSTVQDEPGDGISNLCEDTRDTLEEFLHEQLLTKKLSEEEQKIAKYIIGCLDEQGYFREDIRSTAQQLGVGEQTAEDVLSVLKQLEPPGVCSGSLKECLLNQLEGGDGEVELARLLITDYLELVGKNQIQKIAKRLKCPAEEVEAACEIIRSLNPKPGNSFNSRERTKYILPDVVVVELEGSYEVLINDYFCPDISVGAFYRKLLQEGESGAASNYIYEKIQQAEWIKQCIRQRNDTLVKVVKGIVRCQDLFFSWGKGHLKPLKQADLADMLEIHESTISRAIKDKYLQCGWGVFPMGYFFSKGIALKNQSGTIPVDTVKAALKEIIEGEDKKEPYSDRVLAELMNRTGISISRRTVAKYRSELGIKDTSGRRAYWQEMPDNDK